MWRKTKKFVNCDKEFLDRKLKKEISQNLKILKWMLTKVLNKNQSKTSEKDTKRQNNVAKEFIPSPVE